MENALSTAGMGASAFNDTHQAVKALVQAGIEERAAEAIVNYGQYRVQVSRQDIDRHYATKEEVKTLQMHQKRQESQGSHATRHDVELAKLELQKEIEVVRKEMEANRLTLQKEIEVVRKEIEVVRKEIVKSSRQTILWFVGIVLTYTAIMAALLKYL